jgi:CHAT domain-containing protein/tetratricopeptide (TPR) repeat protein
MGALYKDLHEYPKAIDYFKQSLAINVALGNRKGESVSCNMMGAVYEMVGEMQTSLDYYNRALTLNRNDGDKRGQAVVLNNIGFTYSRLGESKLSLDHFQQALALMRAVGDKWEEAAALDNIGKAWFTLGDQPKSLDHFTQALALRQRLGNRRGAAITLHNLGRLAEAQGDRPKAFDYYQQSLVLHRAVSDRREESYTLHNLGRLYEAGGEKDKALDHLTHAEIIAKELGDRIGETTILYSLALLERNRSNLAGARVILERAIGLAEGVRTTLSSQALRTTYFASVEQIYRLYTEVLMKLGARELAFEAAERRRARTLLELLAEARGGIRRGVDAALLDKERDIQQRLNSKEQRRVQLLQGKNNAVRLAETDSEIRAIAAEYEDARARIRAKSPRFASFMEPEPIPLAEIRKQILDPQTLLVEYSLGDEESYAWLISSAGINTYTLPKRAEIEAQAKKVHEWLASSTRTAQPEALAVLAKMVLGPMAKDLGRHRLLIVADGTLELIPFAALPDPAAPTQPLAVNHELVSLPSASTLAVLRREGTGRAAPSKTVAILADPVFSEDDSRVLRAQAAAQVALAKPLQRALADSGMDMTRIPRLPGTRREAAAIRALLPASGFREALDFEASREAIAGPDVADAGIVHVATHGLLNTVHPELSGLVLSLVDREGKPRDGFLRLHEIYNLELKANLVVLSACQTGLGKEVRGEGLVGLTRGFMYAGTPRVMASLWKVDDRATSELMKLFYQEMLGAGHRTPAAALHAAQVTMWKSKIWNDPYYWAAFSLQGDWN